VPIRLSPSIVESGMGRRPEESEEETILYRFRPHLPRRSQVWYLVLTLSPIPGDLADAKKNVNVWNALKRLKRAYKV